MGSRFNDIVSGSGSTDNATAITLKEYELPANSNARISATINAVNTSNGTSAIWPYELAAKRWGSGDADIVGVPVDLLGDAAKDPGALVWGGPSWDTNGTKIRLKVTGALSTEIEWSVSLRAEGYVVS